MRVIVLGAGVIGVTTAFYLAGKGVEVTVLERECDVAQGASFANGGQLSYSFTDSLAKPSFARRLPSLLLGAHPATRIRLSMALAGWGTEFLRNCTPRRAERNILSLLSTALRSADLLEVVRRDLDLSFSYRAAGKLVLLTTEAELAAAHRTTKLKNAYGCDAEVLRMPEVLEIEPAIAAFERPFVAAVYSASDEVADSRAFSKGLREYLERSGRVEFRFGTTIENVDLEDGRVYGVNGLQADCVVVCLGAWSKSLLQKVGVRCPIYPVRGYSITLPPGSAPLQVSVTSLIDGIVLSCLNGDMRIAGFADFADFSARADPRRIEMLLKTAQALAPSVADFSQRDPQAWAGLRPMTPSGRPMVGESGIEGLYLNIGHGMLGWTLACATAHDLATKIMLDTQAMSAKRRIA